jgi:hypothetical protein
MKSAKSRILSLTFLAVAIVALQIPAAAQLDVPNPQGVAGDSHRHLSQLEHDSQIAKLHRLQAALHRALSVRDYVNGDSADVITQRIRDMLSLWTSDGALLVSFGKSTIDGNYIGNGDPDDSSTCPELSTDPNNRGTICTFFKYVNPAFQPSNKLVSLTAAYKTLFNVHGDTARVYFECHLFNVAIDPGTGNPAWKAVSHVAQNGAARKVHGHWRFSHATLTIPPVPTP